MTIKFHESPMLLEDPEGLVHRFINAHAKTTLARYWCPPAVLACQRQSNRSGKHPHAALPIPNYAPPQVPKLNTLYWPTGALRWAYGLFLVTEQDLDAIRQYVGGEIIDDPRNTESLWRKVKPAVLTMDSGDLGTAIETPMYALPAHRISGAGNDSERLWLLPLVDERYFWQFSRLDAIELSDQQEDQPELTWTELWGYCRDALFKFSESLGSWNSPGTITEYQKPDIREFSKYGNNAALVLEALAQCLGGRVVHKWEDGSINIQRGIAAYASVESNLTTFTTVTAGGDNTNSLGEIFPEMVSVYFPRIVEEPVGDPPVSDADEGFVEWPAEVALSAARTACAESIVDGPDEFPGGELIPWIDGSVKNFINTARGPREDLEDLAYQIALDYYAYQVRRYDITIPGVRGEWAHSGFDDWVIFEPSSRLNNGQWVSQTRAMSYPPNFGVETMLHQVEPGDCDRRVRKGTVVVPDPLPDPLLPITRETEELIEVIFEGGETVEADASGLTGILFYGDRVLVETIDCSNHMIISPGRSLLHHCKVVDSTLETQCGRTLWNVLVSDYCESPTEYEITAFDPLGVTEYGADQSVIVSVDPGLPLAADSVTYCIIGYGCVPPVEEPPP